MKNKKKTVPLNDDPLWYKNAVIYQLHIKSFFDSSGDGIGDFKGLTQKLDYLQSLGVTAIWLLPFYPSPLKDDGYDIADYYSINPAYGTLRDFKELLSQAHAKDLRVITELVINHTSDEHPWFKRARLAKKNSTWRNFYVWSDSSDTYPDARIIFKDFENSNWEWDKTAKAYYWHRFYSHQPDLNFDNPAVQKELFRIVDYWFGMGVDGLRLDAVPYLFEREGTNCENLPETYEFLKKLRKHIDDNFKNTMLLAEANQWPEDAAAYFGKGDEAHMAFHFPLMPRMYMGLQMEDRFPIVDILEQTPAIPETCQWAIFLRNHDELTLEMVTDEERDYMFKMYARDGRSKINVGIRRRLIPLLGDNRRKVELMNILLFSLPGTPIIYYGDEIGMGDNYYLGDRDGVRTPMQWNPDRNAGFSKANPQHLFLPVIIDPQYHYETVNVETQEQNLSSLLWWMRRVIAMRKRFRAFSQGSVKFLFPENPKILAFLRRYQDEIILVVINLSRYSQVVELDLSEYKSFIPEEVFSSNAFPPIKDEPYVITLGPHSHFWFLLKQQDKGTAVESLEHIPEVAFRASWEHLFDSKEIRVLEEKILPRYLLRSRWFGGKSSTIRSVKFDDRVPITMNTTPTYVALLDVKYTSGVSSVYLLPLSFAERSAAQKIFNNYPNSVIARVTLEETDGILYDGAYNEQFHKDLLSMISRRKKIKTAKGSLVCYPGKMLKSILGEKKLELSSQMLKAEQSNTSILYEDLLFLKMFRRLEEGINVDAEIIRYLTERRRFAHAPVFGGAIEYKRDASDPCTLFLAQRFIQNQGEAWSYTIDQVNGFYEYIITHRKEIDDIRKSPGPFFDPSDNKIHPFVEAGLGGLFINLVKLLGKRTGEMHIELASEKEDPNFIPEPFSILYQRSVYQSMWSQSRAALRMLSKNIKKLPEKTRQNAKAVILLEKKILEIFQKITQKKFSAMKIRIHGDYHLGQVICTGKDFTIIDFEGEPAKPLSERRLKRSALRDIAGMMRSFHYAAYGALLLKPLIRKEDIAGIEPWADLWYRYVSREFLDAYIETVRGAPFVPKERGEFEILMNIFLLDKAVYELVYEFNNRPDWIAIPLKGILDIVNPAAGQTI
ncbi:MAG: maltose alpha-D-glucosyltransferase [Candidatus Omnitrophota bacterium]